ncbi:MAG: type II secretion system GspH family protein [Lentisphaeraceae bacterium]|nr:type II secretion system GspH family protein [Lentisphaeraceae bacterium]
MKRSKFSLVELLVVVAIIGVLLSILLPSLHKSRIIAKRVVDLSNARQFATYCTLDAQNNSGKLPSGYRGHGEDDMAWLNMTMTDRFLRDYQMPRELLGCTSFPQENWGQWMYWGGRLDTWYDGSTYETPQRLSSDPTSRTLVTCKQYTAYSNWSSKFAHAPEAYTLDGSYNPNSLPIKPDGLNVIGMDLSGKFARHSSLSVIKNANYIYYLKD